MIPPYKNIGKNATRNMARAIGSAIRVTTKIAQNQNWKCPICGEPLFNGEEIDTHHIIPVAQGGRNDTENLVHLHRACHKQEHSKSKFIA